jgi:hypothetical protein
VTEPTADPPGLPALIARFDQDRAEVETDLDILIGAARRFTEGIPPYLAVAQFTLSLEDRQEAGWHALASLLSMAVWRLAGLSAGALVVAEAGRCPSCDHLTSFHSDGGCWYTVTHGACVGEGANLVCACTGDTDTPR